MAISVENKTVGEKMATSKINWTQYIATAASLFTLFGIDLDPATQVAIIAAIQGVQSIVTWLFRTFWNHPPA